MLRALMSRTESSATDRRPEPLVREGVGSQRRFTVFLAEDLTRSIACMWSPTSSCEALAALFFNPSGLDMLVHVGNASEPGITRAAQDRCA